MISQTSGRGPGGVFADVDAAYYSPREQDAIDQAERFVERELNEQMLDVYEVFPPDPELVTDNWRVELGTTNGDRCVYMAAADSARFELVSIKSGRGCGDELLYP